MDSKSLVGEYLRLRAELTNSMNGQRPYVERLRMDLVRVERELAVADNGFGPFADTLPAVAAEQASRLPSPDEIFW